MARSVSVVSRLLAVIGSNTMQATDSDGGGNVSSVSEPVRVAQLVNNVVAQIEVSSSIFPHSLGIFGGLQVCSALPVPGGADARLVRDPQLHSCTDKHLQQFYERLHQPMRCDAVMRPQIAKPAAPIPTADSSQSTIAA